MKTNRRADFVPLNFTREDYTVNKTADGKQSPVVKSTHPVTREEPMEDELEIFGIKRILSSMRLPWPDGCDYPVRQLFSQVRRLLPFNMIVLPRIEMNFSKIVFTTRPNDWTVERHSEAGFEIHSLLVMSHICYKKL